VSAELLVEHARAVRAYGRAHGRALDVLGYSPACGGCRSARCCTNDSPPLSRPEAEALAHLARVRADLADVPAKVAAQIGLLRETAAPGRGLRDRRGEFPCPFLSPDRRCRVYDHRPLACVQAFSESANRCAASTDGIGGWDIPVEVTAGIIRSAVEIGGKPVRRALAFAPTPGDGPPPLVIGLALVLSDETRHLVAAATVAAGGAR